MQNRNWLTPELTQRRLLGVRMRSSKRRMQRKLVTVICVLLLVLLVTSVSGCGWSLRKPNDDSQVFPPKPALSEPIPSVTYSTSAQSDIQAWRKKLTDTPTTSKP